MLAILAAGLLAAPGCPPAMIAVPAGEFWEGREVSRRHDETPRHRVRLRAFCFDAMLVTHAAFARFVQETHYVTSAEKLGFALAASAGLDDWEWKEIPAASWRAPFGPDGGFPVGPDDPAVSVSWFDAAAYCAHEGKRLPSEAEWEYAARAGRSDARFPWGDDPRLPDGGYGLNFWQGDGHRDARPRDGFVYVSPVRAFPPNRWGVHDPAGNVWQWTADWYAADAYAHAPLDDPRGPPSGSLKVARGGSWWCSAKTCDAFGLFYRGKAKPTAPFANDGFRCAQDAAPFVAPAAR